MLKKLFFVLVFIILCQSINAQTQQPQWKFPIAFEDATGAKDTIFFIWDSSATFYGYDTIWGEYPINIDSSKFNVYMVIGDGLHYSKVWAIPFSYSFEQYIYATTYTYPIKISWDRSLFYSSALYSPVTCAEMDNEYFFYSETICDDFNMFSNDTVMAPAFWWGSGEHFPLFIVININESCCLNGVAENSSQKKRIPHFTQSGRKQYNFEK